MDDSVTGNELAEAIRQAVVRTVRERFPDPKNVPPGPVMGALAAASGALLAQLRYTPNAEEQFCDLVRRNTSVQRKKHAS